jgi:anti-anti-sigma factor
MTLFDQAVTSPQALRLVTVALPGEIDFINASEVRDALALALDSGGAVVIADAAETTFCDCAGVRALIHAHRRAAASARCLRVAASSRGVRRVLELTGADQILDIYPTLAAATVTAHGGCCAAGSASARGMGR